VLPVVKNSAALKATLEDLKEKRAFYEEAARKLVDMVEAVGDYEIDEGKVSRESFEFLSVQLDCWEVNNIKCRTGAVVSASQALSKFSTRLCQFAKEKMEKIVKAKREAWSPAM